jgi:hypothetical protein
MRFEHKFISLIIFHAIAFFLFILAIINNNRIIAFTGLFFFSIGAIIFSPFIPEITENNEKTPRLVIFGILIYISIVILAFLGVAIMNKF